MWETRPPQVDDGQSTYHLRGHAASQDHSRLIQNLTIALIRRSNSISPPVHDLLRRVSPSIAPLLQPSAPRTPQRGVPTNHQSPLHYFAFWFSVSAFSSHSHDLVSTINVDHLPGNRRGAVTRQKNSGRP